MHHGGRRACFFPPDMNFVSVCEKRPKLLIRNRCSLLGSDFTPAAAAFLPPVEPEYFAIASVLFFPTLQGPLSILCVQPGMNLQPGNAPGVSDRLPRRGVILTARGSNRVIYYTVQLPSSPPLHGSPPTPPRLSLTAPLCRRCPCVSIFW